jgi:hypothetical protein
VDQQCESNRAYRDDQRCAVDERCESFHGVKVPLPGVKNGGISERSEPGGSLIMITRLEDDRSVQSDAQDCSASWRAIFERSAINYPVKY